MSNIRFAVRATNLDMAYSKAHELARAFFGLEKSHTVVFQSGDYTEEHDYACGFVAYLDNDADALSEYHPTGKPRETTPETSPLPLSVVPPYEDPYTTILTPGTGTKI